MESPLQRTEDMKECQRVGVLELPTAMAEAWRYGSGLAAICYALCTAIRRCHSFATGQCHTLEYLLSDSSMSIEGRRGIIERPPSRGCYIRLCSHYSGALESDPNTCERFKYYSQELQDLNVKVGLQKLLGIPVVSPKRHSRQA
jgi:hypothetical protein